VTDSQAKTRARSVVSGLVLAAPLAAAALASATLVPGSTTVAHQPVATQVTVLHTIAGTGSGGDPKLPPYVGD
jgi:hypothetical protein